LIIHWQNRLPRRFRDTSASDGHLSARKRAAGGPPNWKNSTLVDQHGTRHAGENNVANAFAANRLCRAELDAGIRGRGIAFAKIDRARLVSGAAMIECLQTPDRAYRQLLASQPAARWTLPWWDAQFLSKDATCRDRRPGVEVPPQAGVKAVEGD
jgi:hypothetical protein